MLTQILSKDSRSYNEVDCKQEKKRKQINTERKSLRTQDVLNYFFFPTCILQTTTVGCLGALGGVFWLVGFIKRKGLEVMEL